MILETTCRAGSAGQIAMVTVLARYDMQRTLQPATGEVVGRAGTGNDEDGKETS